MKNAITVNGKTIELTHDEMQALLDSCLIVTKLDLLDVSCQEVADALETLHAKVGEVTHL